MLFNILFQQSITIDRPTSGGSPNEYGEWVSTNTTPVIMKGSVQPYMSSDLNKGEESIPLREGYDSGSVITVFTDQLTYSYDRQSQRAADKFTYKGQSYVCWRVYDNLDTPLTDMAHCESVFVREDMLVSS